jgi:hypothetical protein
MCQRRSARNAPPIIDYFWPTGDGELVDFVHFAG